MSTLDGGPAFPSHSAAGYQVSSVGMSLRDYFAIRVLSAWLSDAQTIAAMQQAKPGNAPMTLSVAAYDFADAMLKARSA